MYPDSLKKLIETFKYLPGVGQKTAERYAFCILDLPVEKTEIFLDNIKDVKKNIKNCTVCNSLTEEDVCEICKNELRNPEILCVVEDVKSLFLFERLGIYNGLYHVLDGLISPLNGVNPEDIHLDKLLDRIKKGSFKEVILAFKPNVEGETTALYIKRVLENLDLKISRIASGIPIGADIEYMDAMTLERAFSDRKNLE